MAFSDRPGAASRRERWAAGENARRQAAYAERYHWWQALQAELCLAEETARTFIGGAPGERSADAPHLVVRRTERVFAHLAGVTLVEVSRPPGSSAPGYGGYSALASARHRPPGPAGAPAELRLLGPGSATVTDQRLVFHGAERDREWAFGRLIAVEHAADQPVTLLHVSNRRRLSGLTCTAADLPRLRFMLELALAHHLDQVGQFVMARADERARHAAAEPPPPPLALPEDAPGAARTALRWAKIAYIGAPGQPTRWRVAQGVAAGAVTLAILSQLMPGGPAPTASSIAVTSGPATVAGPASTAPHTTAPRATAPGTTAPPLPAPTTVPPTTPRPTPAPTTTAAPPARGCDPSYPDVCIPPPPPDLDCRDIPYTNFRVLSPDPHRLDPNHDGIGCPR